MVLLERIWDFYTPNAAKPQAMFLITHAIFQKIAASIEEQRRAQQAARYGTQEMSMAGQKSLLYGILL